MQTTPADDEDPLIAALPPATDYITYLTILEYQLKPHNISTLNRLLSEDDGTLAQEIGWDLISKVVNLAPDSPEASKECLDIISRRGNPREVLIRVSEELESFTGPLESDEEDGEDEDELITFPGEATRIHLGNMKLEGLPAATSREQGMTGDLHHEPDNTYVSTTPAAGRLLQFQCLLNTLGTVLGRIKTQYPSRFYATSLPPALKALRSYGGNLQFITAFLGFLEKLSNKKKPPLPPRVPSAASYSERSVATVPDPEGQDEGGEVQISSPDEKAIVQRLLQAVLLEVLDDFAAASTVPEDMSSLALTARLREAIEPKRSVPGKPTETERWLTGETLRQTAALLTRFAALAKHLDLDVDRIFQEVIEKSKKSPIAPEEVPESDSEFPRSPSDISFSTPGTILLYTISRFQALTTDPTILPTLPLPTFGETVLILLRITIQQGADFDSDPLPLQSSLATTDAILSLAYASLHKPNTDLSLYNLDPDLFTKPLLTLLALSAHCPDPLLRDAAHSVAKSFFHSSPDPSVKLNTIHSLLRDYLGSSVGPPQPLLAAAVLAWLKDETAAYGTPQQPSQSGPSIEITGINPRLLLEDNNPEHDDSLHPQLQLQLQSLLFRWPPDTVSAPHSSSSASPSSKTPELISPFLPYYTAALNLYALLLSRLPAVESKLTAAGALADALEDAVRSAQRTMTGGAGGEEVAAGEEQIAAQLGPGFYALSDALGRVRGLRGRARGEDEAARWREGMP